MSDERFLGLLRIVCPLITALFTTFKLLAPLAAGVNALLAVFIVAAAFAWIARTLSPLKD